MDTTCLLRDSAIWRCLDMAKNAAAHRNITPHTAPMISRKKVRALGQVPLLRLVIGALACLEPWCIWQAVIPLNHRFFREACGDGVHVGLPMLSGMRSRAAQYQWTGVLSGQAPGQQLGNRSSYRKHQPGLRAQTLLFWVLAMEI